MVPMVGWLLIGLVLVSVAACDAPPELQPPAAIQLQGNRVAAGEPFDLRVAGLALDESTRAVLTLDHGNRNQVINELSLWGNVHALDVQADFAYVANSTKGLTVVDVRDFSQPVIVGSLELPGRTLQVLPHGNLLVAANGLSGVHLVDISTPASPVLLATIEISGRAFDLDIAGNLLFVAAGGAGLQVVDISTPRQPVLVSRLELPGRSLAVKQFAGDVYLAGTEVLAAIDVTRPELPKIRGLLPLEHNAFQILPHGEQLYLTLGAEGILIVDPEPPEQLAVVGQLKDLGHVLRMVTEANRAYLASTYGTLVLDLDTRPLPTLLGGVTGQRRVTDLVARGGMILAVDNFFGLEVIDLRSPQPFAYGRLAESGPATLLFDTRLAQSVALGGDESPSVDAFLNRVTTLGQLDGDFPRLLASDASALVQRGARLYLGTEQGILTLDNSRPDQFGVVARSTDGLPIQDLLAVDDFLLAAAGDHGLLVYRLDAANLPELVRQIPLRGAATALAVHGQYLYLTSLLKGLFVYSLADPASPQPVTNLSRPYPLNEFSRSEDIVIHNELAYIADGPNGLVIVDLAVPGAPAMLAMLPTGDSARSLAIREPYLYLADSRDGLRVYDISRPRHPLFLSRLQVPTSARGCLVAEQLLLVSTTDAGLVRLEEPTEALTGQSLDKTHRVFSFPPIERAGRYSLRIFNDAGGEELIGGLSIESEGSGP